MEFLMWNIIIEVFYWAKKMRPPPKGKSHDTSFLFLFRPENFRFTESCDFFRWVALRKRACTRRTACRYRTCRNRRTNQVFQPTKESHYGGRMQTQISKRKNITIHFGESEKDLLEEFDIYCKSQYSSRSGWIKRAIHKAIQENKWSHYSYRQQPITCLSLLLGKIEKVLVSFWMLLLFKNIRNIKINLSRNQF